MIFKKTWINISDSTNVEWVQIFHLYKGFNRKKTGIGNFVKGSARVVEPPRLEYKGFKYKYNVKGDICRGIIVRTRYVIRRNDGVVIFFKANNMILIRKRQDVKPKYIYGPTSEKLKRKRFITIFKTVI